MKTTLTASTALVLLVCSAFVTMTTIAFRFTTPTSLSIIRQAFRSKSPRFQSTSSSLPSLSDDGDNKRPSIAIVGSGAVGGYYGARLWESGSYDVKFQMRGENLKKSTSDGFVVTSIDGDIFIPPDQLQAFEDPNDVGPVDWVVVCLKSSSLSDIPDLVYPLLESKRTRILTIMNGLIEEDLIQLLKERAGGEEFCAALYGGMALVCSNRTGPGTVNHSFAGLLSGGLAISQEQLFTDEENQQAFQDLWAPTSIDIAYEQSLLAGRWRKCLWNLPFNGISVAMGGITVDKIVNDSGLRQLANIIMDETVSAANADMAAHGFGKEMYLDDADKKKMMDLSDNMGPYR